ncbi:hypothetical protein DSAG12_02274 [Promethearchaeum syntrophicum]|uniref:Uncharacterized protein n=1 Tax=Promethearchaeum syntrophicum TaxID=2594042 RepID=A0A5B9DBD5_9ARCH|nr:hypothetical protein [Candidatus Prometheoarchaeum syntrophicum]QEE16444.1 hypothetical protein DSAG12_02274 [Candidatus Prometheoarchaeum syntrophicum]
MSQQTKQIEKIENGDVEPDNVEESQLFADLSKNFYRFKFRVFDKQKNSLSEYFVNVIKGELSSVLNQSIGVLNPDDALYEQMSKDLPIHDGNGLYFLVSEINLRKNTKKEFAYYLRIVNEFLVKHFAYIRENAI